MEVNSAMVVTKQFSLTSTQYFKILVSVFIKKRWWFLALIWLFGIGTALSSARDYLYIIFAFLYTILVWAQLWKFSNSKENSNLLKERYFQIDSEKLTGFIEGGSEGTIMISDFIKVIITNESYLLYHAKNQFVFIPKNSFQSPADEMWFQKEIITRRSWLRK